MMDLSALNLTPKIESVPVEDAPKITLARERVLEEANRTLEAQQTGDLKLVSLVVIGHVDAGKSTLMGRLLYETGRLDEKTRIANERGSTKAGKRSFSWAWSLDGTTEERERGITMDIALQSLKTQHRQVTILDAPGHKDFVPNMISGASQADCALLVVDASPGEFEAGFDRGGQTREHVILVRSLGVSQIIVAINKLDVIGWDQTRFREICKLMRPFLVQSGFHPSKMQFVPVGAVDGVNLAEKPKRVEEFSSWYGGPTLVDCLDKLEPPARDIASPLRLPISNVFKGQSAGIGVTGRLCSGVVQVGERLRVLPGDETAAVKSIEVEEQSASWAMAGTNATLFLTGIDPIHLAVGSVLCPPSDVVPLATIFTARIIIFDVQLPVTAGASVELYHHSRDVPATIANLISTLDRTTGTVVKKKPRVLTKGVSAEVQIVLRSTSLSSSAPALPIPLEPFSVNKDMGRILLRRGGETIGAGIVLEIFG
ncbi:EF Tu GTP binding domain-containing protein [Armillaria novae-zelandiae]|uniref:Elongation factor 1 alpha-like protein n=1 Tax=Armillaria novae-zelandiae TaxID=153914 RepID=A0AA39PU98_9AGAR|nr:EF Tu GTP binding domain-containing protein [Armillaria novae-zelandiae]